MGIYYRNYIPSGQNYIFITDEVQPCTSWSSSRQIMYCKFWSIRVKRAFFKFLFSLCCGARRSPLYQFFVSFSSSSSLRGVPSFRNLDLHSFFQCFPFLHLGHKPVLYAYHSLDNFSAYALPFHRKSK